MIKLESNFRNMVLVLSGITMFAALSLASVYTYTKDPIAQSKIAKQQNAIKEVLPTSFDHLDASPIVVVDDLEITQVYNAYDKDNHFIGAAVESSSNNGYGGKVILMVGFDPEGNIFNYSVLQQNETPGLGTKMAEWFKTNRGNQSVVGRNPGNASLTVSNDGGDVDAITAATISSRAFLFAVQTAYSAFASSKVTPATKAPELPSAATDSMTNDTNTEKKGLNNE